MTYTTIIPDETRRRAAEYVAAVRSGRRQPGQRLGRALEEVGLDGLEELDVGRFLQELMNTKEPQIFAESAVAGDGSDWSAEELGMLGDVSVSVPVRVFDNGNHDSPVVHDEPFRATLVYTPGALLRNGRGCVPADWDEVTDANGGLCAEGYYGLYRRRLLPVLRHINDVAAGAGCQALVTVPGMGCGQFAGPFRGALGRALEEVLRRLLGEFGSDLPAIRAIYYDPFDECENGRHEIHGVSLMVRPLRRGNGGKSQLCRPEALADEGDDFSGLALFSLVAWDHVSWPGNDFFAGSRCTDDGVKAAATDSMRVLTGVEGSYDAGCGKYMPPRAYRTWGEVVDRNGLVLRV
ncbi:MAG: hypothetical protein ACQCXQ_16205 [Verrucomicrobiales bacterium]|nr:hypothetical protein [Verrucomicrobiota bacterium JB025]